MPDPKHSATHVGRGFLMGGADVIPGVSGGTVALILGVYPRLVTAIGNVDGTLFGHLKAKRWAEAAEHLDLKLVVPLGLGILCGVAALGSVMHTLLEDHRTPTLAVFFGLIAASTVFVAKMVPRWSPAAFGLAVAGAVAAFFLMGLPALDAPPDHAAYYFFCGTVGICAMILPGVSGAFLLLVLGKYSAITGIIKGFAHGEFAGDDVVKVGCFAVGCLVGLLSFAKVVKWALRTHPSWTLAALAGLMLGSLRRLWPFQVKVAEEPKPQWEPVPFSEVPVDGTLWAAVGLAIAAAAFVFVLERISPKDEHALAEL